ncbi:biotin--[acetyl-CoA-carboxylase] ligase [Rothia sp. ZJ1223]|uniref:biotin--[acetyl-CoA-carboxylase] ligase n=1 Tax=Rothia sp. ZJ1223 TaxID=2811098 RepID=UPI001957BA8C|nr:biotin--[acetyl-CoA-carboxylase] ligase [Rothia sp. ZJ1223]MBM7051363.1 biotin--[acetyl-CoA-carboxylase] ligase [Rothia sp. ZJ1223]
MQSTSKQLTPLNIPGYARAGFFSQTESTNTDALKLLASPDATAREKLGELSVLATDDQRAGRGRLDRQWTAPAGSALCATFIVRPHASTQPLRSEALRWLTMILALAARQTLVEQGVNAGIKWPNDLVVGGRKIAGILAQLSIEPTGEMSAVVGIGINTAMNPLQLPFETATSMAIEGAKSPDNLELLQALAASFADIYRRFAEAGGDASAPLTSGVSLVELLRLHTITLGQEVAVHLPGDDIVQGVAVDLADDGEIMVRDPRGRVKSYAVGDVVHLRPAS